MNHGTMNMKNFFSSYFIVLRCKKILFHRFMLVGEFSVFIQFHATSRKFLRTLKSRTTTMIQNNTQSPALKSLLEKGSRTTELCAEHSHSHGDNRERLLLFRDCWTRIISCFFLSHSRISRSVFHSDACAPSSVGGRVQLSKNAFLPLVESFKRRFFRCGKSMTGVDVSGERKRT